MRRREFVTLLGGATLAWPLAAHAQQVEREPLIGVLMPFAAAARNIRLALGRSLRGWKSWGASTAATCGSNIAQAWGTQTRCKNTLESWLRCAGVVLATGVSTVLPLQQTTHNIPIVFAVVPDPVGAGLVDGLARPGGNVTGFAAFEYGLSGKWLEF